MFSDRWRERLLPWRKLFELCSPKHERTSAMKLNSSWLATSVLLFAIFACNLSNNNNNNRATVNRPANAEIYVDQIHMATDEYGKPGDSSTRFGTSDGTVD